MPSKTANIIQSGIFKDIQMKKAGLMLYINHNCIKTHTYSDIHTNTHTQLRLYLIHTAYGQVHTAASSTRGLFVYMKSSPTDMLSKPKSVLFSHAM